VCSSDLSMTDDLKVGMSVTEIRLEQKFRVR
jgi:hypothetical protein